ncbi:MAG: hypothetical protein Q7T22_04010 [Serpentinimonas sp.]|nr:hypothetical protein [Serpentinimonas sp.]
MTTPRSAHPTESAHPSATRHPGASRWAALAKGLRRGLLCALLWIFVAEWSLHLAIDGLGMSLIWPANGVALSVGDPKWAVRRAKLPVAVDRLYGPEWRGAGLQRVPSAGR